jgi:putative DNA primase/helicase
MAHQGGRKFDIRCPFNPEHDNAAIFEGADGKLGFHCFHNSCRDYDWNALREKMEPGWRSAKANYTDVGNAKRLVRSYGADIRYCHAWGKWLIWDGARWQIDETGDIERLAKKTVAALFGEAATLSDEAREKFVRHALKSEQEQRIKAMIALARSEPGVPVRPNQLDVHPFLLNVLNGTLDLRSGKLREPRREDLITKLVPVAYDPVAKAPAFTRFIVEVMCGRRDLIRYLQRALGYALTGSTSEQVFFVLYGSGANGKSTLLTLIHNLLGPDYAMDTPADTFSAKQFGDGIPNDLARLKGSRFVTAVELEGRKLDEPKLKRITGQDQITARFMRAEFFQFTAELKLFIACNEMPTIDSSGHAIWRRIRLIPFDAKITKPDRHLPDRLRRELPGVLAWLVRGCLAWQKRGLGLPEPISAATKAYRQEMDAVGRFLADCCESVKEAKIGAKVLYEAYLAWCKRAEEEPLKQAAFGRKLTRRGLPKARSGDGGSYEYTGLALVAGLLNDLNGLNDSYCQPIENPPIELTQKKVQTEPNSFSTASPAPPAMPALSADEPITPAAPAKTEWLI